MQPAGWAAGTRPKGIAMLALTTGKKEPLWKYCLRENNNKNLLIRLSVLANTLSFLILLLLNGNSVSFLEHFIQLLERLHLK